MIELIPYMLIQLIWHPDHPGQFAIERQMMLYGSLAECEAHGADYVASHAERSGEHGGAKLTYQCMPVPARAEFDALFAEIERKKQEQERNAAQDQGEGK